MNAWTSGLLAAGLAYLVGSIPFGYLTARVVRGIDIRQHGSGNIGATNVGRVLGSRWGIFVLALDLLKGLLPVWQFPASLFSEPETWGVHAAVAIGVATIVGHMAPCWLGFRGGKGVATALGVVLFLAPWASLISAGSFAITFAVWRIVSLSSIIAVLAFAAAELTLLWPDPFSKSKWSLAAFSLAVPLLIIIRHRSNIGRLLRGEEPRFRSGGDQTNTTPPATEVGQ
jgi:glycerol-3-phosphate acyltransferase PlsY